MLECGVMADCSNDRDAVVGYGKVLSMTGIHKIPHIVASASVSSRFPFCA